MSVTANLGDYYYYGSSDSISLQMTYLPPVDASGLYDVNTFYVLIYIDSLSGSTLASSGNSDTYTFDETSSSAFYIGFVLSQFLSHLVIGSIGISHVNMYIRSNYINVNRYIYLYLLSIFSSHPT